MSQEIKNQNYKMLKNLFKSMITGSKTAKYLAVAYVIISFILAYRHSNNTAYCVALILGGVLMGAYAFKFLWLKKINPQINAVGELLLHIQEYRKQTLKRQKYEQFVMVLWILTLVPAYLQGKELTTTLVVALLVVFYLFIVLGNFMFTHVKKQFEDMDDLAQHL